MTEATQRLDDFILANPPYKAVDDAARMEIIDALLDMDCGWPADFRDGFGRKTDSKGTTQLWTVNAGDLMLLVWLLAKNRREAATRVKKLEEVFTGPNDTPEVISPLSWLREMIDECKRRWGRDACDDRDAFFQMISEVETFEKEARAVLQPSGEK